jgi:hypothetical protein
VYLNFATSVGISSKGNWHWQFKHFVHILLFIVSGRRVRNLDTNGIPTTIEEFNNGR